MATKTKSSKRKLTKGEFKRILNTHRQDNLTKDQAGRLKILEFIDIYADDEHKENIILADGLDKAFLGLAYRDGEHGAQVAVYGIFSCIHTLQLDNKWSWDEAEEYFNFNTRWAYVGEYTPMFIEEMPR
jgi:hypothetical protein